MIRISVLFLLTLLQSFLSRGSEQCAVEPTQKSEIKLDCLPTVINQADSMWCFLFATRTLAQQDLCLSNGKNASQNISVRGVIARYNDELTSEAQGHSNNDSLFDWKAGGDIFTALKAISGKKMPSEACAPTADFLSWAANLSQNDNQTLTPTDVLKFEYHDYLLNLNVRHLERAQADCNLYSDFAGEGNILPLVRFARDVMDAAASSNGNINDYMANVFIPDRCASDAIKMPTLNVQTAAPKTRQETESKIDSILQTGKMVGITICPQALEDPQTTNCKPPHALSVGGKRTVCCGNVCRTEYKVFNSLFDHYSPSSDGSKWYPSDSVLDGIDHFRRSDQESASVIADQLKKVKAEIQSLKDRGVDENALNKAVQRNASADEVDKIMQDPDQKKIQDLKSQSDFFEKSLKSWDTLTWINN